MADGHILKNRKRPYLRNTVTDLHKIWHDDAFWPSEGYGQLKFSTFKNPRWRTAAILKIENLLCLQNGSTDRREIYQDDAYCASVQDRKLKFQILKDGGWPPS